MRVFGHIFYRYIWISFNLLLFYFYRYSKRKHATGLEGIPNDRPVLFCSNHPNAFMDALMVGSTLRRRTWFLARSDVFRKKGLANFLSFIGIVPIYRLQEGVENLAKNDETFDKCSQMLEQKKAIIVFSEGLCIQERRLRKLKKGTARIAFSAEEKNNFNLGLLIVPVGVNYSATPWKFRSQVHIRFGEPYEVKSYEELYRTDKARAINQFTRDLEEKMREQLLIIEDRQNDFLVAQLEEMLIPQWAEKGNADPRNPQETHPLSKKIASAVNELQRTMPEKAEALRKSEAAYAEQLRLKDLRDWLVRKNNFSAANLIGDLLIFILGFGIFAFGFLTNFIPYKIPWLIQKKVVRHIEWSASVTATIGVFLWQIWWLLQSLVVALVFRDWYILFAFMIAVPLCGLFAQWYSVRWKKFAGKMRWKQLDEKERSGLIFQREEIISEIESSKG
jgi:glycerol-3-phosphate O-acyltransferase / dihydroxyacetone phosphate acyltransferase